jgi:hypothetical protein
LRRDSADGAINSRLWRHAGGDGKGHGQRQRDQADGYAGDEVGQKLVAIIIAQQADLGSQAFSAGVIPAIADEPTPTDAIQV